MPTQHIDKLLLPFVLQHLNDDKYPSFQYVDREQSIFQIPWQYKGGNSWKNEIVDIPVAWAKHKNKSTDPSIAKRNFRNALNCSPQFEKVEPEVLGFHPKSQRALKFKFWKIMLERPATFKDENLKTKKPKKLSTERKVHVSAKVQRKRKVKQEVDSYNPITSESLNFPLPTLSESSRVIFEPVESDTFCNDENLRTKKTKKLSTKRKVPLKPKVKRNNREKQELDSYNSTTSESLNFPLPTLSESSHVIFKPAESDTFCDETSTQSSSNTYPEDIWPVKSLYDQQSCCNITNYSLSEYIDKNIENKCSTSVSAEIPDLHETFVLLYKSNSDTSPLQSLESEMSPVPIPTFITDLPTCIELNQIEQCVTDGDNKNASPKKYDVTSLCLEKDECPSTTDLLDNLLKEEGITVLDAQGIIPSTIVLEDGNDPYSQPPFSPIPPIENSWAELPSDFSHFTPDIFESLEEYMH